MSLGSYCCVSSDTFVSDISERTSRNISRNHIRLTAEGVAEDHPLIGSLSLGLAPAPARPVEPETLRVIIRAIREARQVSAHYVSFSQTDGRLRRIEPHALGL
jgi:predicted DNA-binding transcriptional regulator YafY